MVLILCISSDHALYLYKVSHQSLKRFEAYCADAKQFQGGIMQ